MPELSPGVCQKHFLPRWGYEYRQRASDDLGQASLWRHYLQSKREQYTDWYYLVKLEYEKDRRLARVFRWCSRPREVRDSSAFGKRLRDYKVSQSTTERLRSKFTALAEEWRRETKFSSSVDDKVLHSAYQSIIAMGRSAVPLVLEELECRRGHWFWALHFMTGVDPVPKGANIEVARDAWLKWGKQEGYMVE